MKTLEQLKHFHSRFGFGLSLDDYLGFKKGEEFNEYQWLENQLRSNKVKPLPTSKTVKPFSPKEMAMNKADRQEKIKEDRKIILKINRQWIKQMATNESPLQEKMALFWHDHFACSPKSSFMASSYLELIRREALGKFRSLLHGISKEPAMLLYLNNQQNRKGHPNENFAREVMELFTLGIGNYSEQDIKESARAFTGWSVGKDKKYKLNERQHDYGSKVFFGEKKNWTGEEIIDRILEEKRAAEYVSGKMAKYFLGTEPSQDLQNKLTEKFYKSDYEVSSVIRALAESDEFWSEKNIGQDILPPVELLVRMERDFQLNTDDSNFEIIVQKSLGQVIFQPPNVAGWPSGKGWIDTSTLPTRLSLSRAILLENEIKSRKNKSFAQGEDLTENLPKRLKKGLSAVPNIAAIENA
ncbi:MAG: DUF1800 domain-containing protein, partial [Bacteroidota bacterium]